MDTKRFAYDETVEYHLVYAELIRAARQRATVTYKEIAQLVGLPTSGHHMASEVGKLLGAVSQNEIDHKRPMLSALVIRVDGRVGPGFFGLARENELLMSDKPEDAARFLEEQRQKIYDTWKPKSDK